MKHSICRPFALALLTIGLGLNAHAGSDSGLVDFGKFTAPGKGSEFFFVLESYTGRGEGKNGRGGEI